MEKKENKNERASSYPKGSRGTLVVISGPTAVGKTAATLAIAKHLKSAVINADSRQIYAEIPIGTAAPTAEEIGDVKHYFVGTRSVIEPYSAAGFETDALEIIEHETASGRIALMSGGSMMYIDAVCKGIDDIPTIDEAIRRQVKNDLEHHGLETLLRELKKADPKHYEEVDRNNPRRVCHAIEICRMTRKPYSDFRTQRVKERPFDIIRIGLNRSREELYQRINERVEHMIGNGMIEEAVRCLPHRGTNALNTLGYKELFDYLDGNISLQEAIRQIQSHTREYARKQLTWLRRIPEVVWFHPEDIHEITSYIDRQIREKRSGQEPKD